MAWTDVRPFSGGGKGLRLHSWFFDFCSSCSQALYFPGVSRTDIPVGPMSSNTSVYYLHATGARVYAIWGQICEGA